MDSPRRSRRIAGLSPEVKEYVAPHKPTLCVSSILFISSFLGSVVFVRNMICNY